MNSMMPKVMDVAQKNIMTYGIYSKQMSIKRECTENASSSKGEGNVSAIIARIKPATVPVAKAHTALFRAFSTSALW